MFGRLLDKSPNDNVLLEDRLVFIKRPLGVSITGGRLKLGEGGLEADFSVDVGEPVRLPLPRL